MGMTIEEENKFMEESKEHFKEWHDMNYIPRADYENRLKADMVVILEEVRKQLKDMRTDFYEQGHKDVSFGINIGMEEIQRKIVMLKGNENGNE